MGFSESFTIRKATKDDMSHVHRLIMELAEFIKMVDQVKTEPSVLEDDGFNTKNPPFRCFVVETSDGLIIGYALYYTSYSTWIGKSIFLEDLYVQAAYRKRGIGKQLFMAVAKVAHEINGRLDFHVLAWNPAVNFYKSLGAVNLTEKEEWQTFRLNPNTLSKLFCKI